MERREVYAQDRFGRFFVRVRTPRCLERESVSVLAKPDRQYRMVERIQIARHDPAGPLAAVARWLNL
jgi:hypothetical protein